MSVDREYRIRISTVTDGDAGAAARGLQDTGKAAEKAGEDVKLLETKGREFHELTHKLNEILPFTGNLLRAAFNPESIGITALIGGIELAKSLIESYNKKLEDMAETAAKADFAAGVEALRDALREAVDTQDEYIRKQQEILKGEHNITTELANRLSLIAAIQAAGEQQAEAEKTLALAKIQQDEALGKINERQAIEQKAAVEKAYVDKKNRDEESEFSKEQNARVDAANQALQKQGQLNADQAEAAKKLADAKEAQGLAKGAPTADDVRKAQDAADAALAKFQSQAGAVGLPNVGVATPLPGTSQAGLVSAQEEARRLQDRATQLENLKSQADAANAVDIDSLQKDADHKKELADANAKALAKAQEDAKKALDEHTNPQFVAARAGAQSAADQQIDVQMHTELARLTQQLQQKFVQEGPAMTRADAQQLLQGLREFGAAVLSQTKDAVTKQQLDNEIAILKRMVEGKGK